MADCELIIDQVPSGDDD